MARSKGNARRGIAASLPFVLLLTACGARWSDEERAQVLARNRGGGQAIAGTDNNAAPGVVDPVTGALIEDVGAAGADAGTGAVDPVTGTRGPAAAAARSVAGAKPCAAKSSAPGVADRVITVGNISTVTGPVPGLGESSMAAARAYVAYRNSTGGVCGRRIELRTADDGAENSRYRAAVVDLEPRVLGLAAGFAGGDGGAVDVIEAKKLPAVLTAFNDSMQAAGPVFDINPPFANVNAKIGKYEYLWDQGIRTAALVYIDIASVKSEIAKQRAQMEAVGIRVVYDKAVPVSTLSYDSAARGVANSKADYLFYPAAGNLNASMARSMKDTGYKLKVGEYLTAYGSNFIELSGDAAEDAVSWTRSVPNEEVGSNREQVAFLEWMDRTAPGVTTDTFAADSWAAAKAFFDAVEAIPGPITRDALLARLRAVETYDADGFYGPIKLGKKLTNGCFIAMKVVNGKWQRLTPARGFLC